MDEKLALPLIAKPSPITQPLDVKPELVSLPTHGEGDCAFHALLGAWDAGSRELVCSDVPAKRRQLREAIIHVPQDADISNWVAAGIAEWAMSNQSGGGEAIRALREKNQRFTTDQAAVVQRLREQFLAELARHEVVIAHVRGENRSNTSLHDQFHAIYNGSSDASQTLRESLAQRPALQQAWDSYQQESNQPFDWQAQLTPAVLGEYADMIGTPREWLRASELAIMAQVFKRTVIYYPHPGAVPQELNPGQESSVAIQFTNNVHFERRVTQAERERLLPAIPFSMPYSQLKPVSMPAHSTFQQDDKPNLSSTALRDILRHGYTKRAKLHSIEFDDHELPISDVHFTIQEREAARERKHLSADKKANTKSAPTQLADQPTEQDLAQNTEETQQPLLVTDIFTPRPALKGKDQPDNQTALSLQPIHRVLILGQAGSGKTTLSKYIAHQWVEGHLWQERYDQVFWLRLRDLHSLTNAELTELTKLTNHNQSALLKSAALLHCLCLDKTARSEISIQTIYTMLIQAPRRTLLLLDGFDEIAQVLSSGDKRAEQQKELLDAVLILPADMILTSRDYSLPPKKYAFDRCLMNQGFTDQQVLDYIQLHFSSLPTPDEKLTNKVKELIRHNDRLWSRAHNPLILHLACDFYRRNHGKADLSRLGLLDLYNDNLKTFLRVYLDKQSRYLNKLKLAWSNTQEASLADLVSLCPVEMEFLQVLAFQGIERDLALFNKATKEHVLKTLYKKYPQASEAPFLNALKLGMLHEIPGREQSSLAKDHEFVHLTFQEHLAARYLVDALLHYDPDAYAWLRDNKYNPRQREVLNFICAMMVQEKCPEFWEVLLQEQTDITGVGYFQLLLYSLEAAQYDNRLPELQQYLQKIEQGLLHCIIHTSVLFQKEQLTENNWLFDTLKDCPHIWEQLGDSFWKELGLLLKATEAKIYNQAYTLLESIALQARHLSAKNRQWLLTTLLQPAKSENLDYRQWRLASLLQIPKEGIFGGGMQYTANKVLRSYVAQARYFFIEERSQLLTTLLQATKDKNYDVQLAAAEGLASYADQAKYFSIEEDSQLLTTLLQTIKNENPDVRKLTARGLASCATQAMHFSAEQRGPLLTTLLQAYKDKNQGVQLAAAEGLASCATQAMHFSIEERGQLLTTLTTLLQAAKDEDWDVRRAAAKGLASYTVQAMHFSAEERSQLLTTLLQTAKDKDWHVQQAAAEALGSCATQAMHFSAEQRGPLLTTLLQAAKDESSTVRWAAAEGLASCATQAMHFSIEERGQLLTTLTTLLQAAKDEDWSVQQAVAKGLASYTAQAMHFSAEERSQLLTTLLQAAKDESSTVRWVAVKWLASCATQAMYFSIEERSQLLTTLLQAAKDEDWSVQQAAAEALGSCATQAMYFSIEDRSQLLTTLLEDRSQLLTVLLQVAKTEDRYLKEAAVLAHYAAQARYFPAEERSQLLTTLLQATKDENQNMQQAAAEALGSCATQAMHFSAEECSQMLTILLQIAESINKNRLSALNIYSEGIETSKKKMEKIGRARVVALGAVGVVAFGVAGVAIIGASLGANHMLSHVPTLPERNKPMHSRVIKSLELCAAQALCFSAKERQQLLTILLQDAEHPSENVQEVVAKALRSYVAQVKDFSAEERSQLLLALLALVASTSELMCHESVKILSHMSFTHQDYLSLSYAQSYRPLSMLSECMVLSLEELLRAYLTDSACWVRGSYPRRALWLQFIVRQVGAGNTSIIMQKGQIQVFSPQSRQPAIIPIPEVNRALLIKDLVNVLTAQVKTLGMPLSNSLVVTLPPPEIKATASNIPEVAELSGRMDKVESKIEQHDTRLDVHEIRITQVENQVNQIQDSLNKQEATLENHEAKFTTYEKMGNTLKARVVDLDSALLVQAYSLRQDIQRCKDDTKAAVALSEQRLDDCMAQFAKFEKHEEAQQAVYRQQYQTLQSEHHTLHTALQALGLTIKTLEATGAHSIAELAKLEALMPTLQAMKAQYAAQEKRLQAREALFQDPKIAEFYRIMHTRLTGFYLVCTIAATGLVKIESSASMKEKIATLLVGTLGENIPVPGAKAAAQFVNAMIAWNRKHREEQARNHTLETVTPTALSFADKEIAIELAIQEIIRRYAEQIKAIKPAAISTLALCAVNRIAHGIQELDPSENEPLPTQLANWLHRIKDFQQGTFGHKTLEVEPGALSSKPKTGFVQRVTTEAKTALGKDGWNEEGIFRLTGIRSQSTSQPNEEIYWYADLDLSRCDCIRYGFRYIEDFDTAQREAKIQGFTQTSDNVPHGSWQFTPPPQARQAVPIIGKISFFGSVTQATAAVLPDQAQDLAQAAGNQLAAPTQKALISIGKRAGEKAEELVMDAVERVTSGLSL